ncbi:unnamed protein product [Symbiodinium sp. KB8]|nr:unnamed protein product [Symbiodinium sp. KB8]
MGGIAFDNSAVCTLVDASLAAKMHELDIVHRKVLEAYLELKEAQAAKTAAQAEVDAKKNTYQEWFEQLIQGTSTSRHKWKWSRFEPELNPAFRQVKRIGTLEERWETLQQEEEVAREKYGQYFEDQEELKEFTDAGRCPGEWFDYIPPMKRVSDAQLRDRAGRFGALADRQQGLALTDDPTGHADLGFCLRRHPDSLQKWIKTAFPTFPITSQPTSFMERDTYQESVSGVTANLPTPLCKWAGLRPPEDQEAQPDPTDHEPVDTRLTGREPLSSMADWLMSAAALLNCTPLADDGQDSPSPPTAPQIAVTVEIALMATEHPAITAAASAWLSSEFGKTAFEHMKDSIDLDDLKPDWGDKETVRMARRSAIAFAQQILDRLDGIQALLAAAAEKIRQERSSSAQQEAEVSLQDKYREMFLASASSALPAAKRRRTQPATKAEVEALLKRIRAKTKQEILRQPNKAYYRRLVSLANVGELPQTPALCKEAVECMVSAAVCAVESAPSGKVLGKLFHSLQQLQELSPTELPGILLDMADAVRGLP